MIAGFFCSLITLACPPDVQAETEVISIYHLPLSEAEAAVRSQLSASGSVAAMPSRRILIVDDDAVHVRNVRALLKRLDVPAVQFRARVGIETRQSQSHRSIEAAGEARLSGGWMRVSLDQFSGSSNSRRSYQLQLSSNKAGHIEAGKVIILPATRSWLQGYGIVSTATIVPVTGGFDIVVRPAADGLVHVRIQPWLKQLRQGSPVRGKRELLIDLGSAAHPATPPNSPANAPIRFNARPGAGTQEQRVDVLGAATELTIPLDQEVTIAAVDGEARHMGQALLAGRSQVGEQQMMIRLRVHQL